MYSRNFSGNIGTGLASVVLAPHPPPEAIVEQQKKHSQFFAVGGGAE